MNWALETLAGPLALWLTEQFPRLSQAEASLLVTGIYVLFLALASTVSWRIWRSFQARWSRAGDGDKITVLIADLAGDGKDLRYTTKLLDELDSVLGREAFAIRRYTGVLQPNRDGDQVAARLEAERTAKRWLSAKNADLLIWGRIEPASGSNPAEYVLEFTLREDGANAVERSSFAHSARFPVDFGEALGDAVAALIAVEIAPIWDRPGQAIGDELERAVDRLRPIVGATDITVSASVRGSLLHSFGIALVELGKMRGDERLIEEGIQAYRAALTEWTQDHVPLDWA